MEDLKYIYIDELTNVISVITIIMSPLNVSVVYSIVVQNALTTFTSWMKSHTALCVGFNWWWCL